MRANISYIGTTKVLSSPNDMFISPYQTLGECLVCSYCELLHKFFWIIFGFSFFFLINFFKNFFQHMLLTCAIWPTISRSPGTRSSTTPNAVRQRLAKIKFTITKRCAHPSQHPVITSGATVDRRFHFIAFFCWERKWTVTYCLLTFFLFSFFHLLVASTAQEKRLF